MDEKLSNNTGIISYVFSILWLLIPIMTLILFDELYKHVSGISIQYFQMLYVIITLSISYYFVDKNSYQSKMSAIGSASHNSLLTFLLIRTFMHFNPFKTQLNNFVQNGILLGLLIILFIVQSISTNNKDKSTYNLLHIFGLILINIFIIHIL